MNDSIAEATPAGDGEGCLEVSARGEPRRDPMDSWRFEDVEAKARELLDEMQATYGPAWGAFVLILALARNGAKLTRTVQKLALRVGVLEDVSDLDKP